MSVQLAAYAKYEASENDKEELMAFATAFAALEFERDALKRYYIEAGAEVERLSGIVSAMDDERACFAAAEEELRGAAKQLGAEVEQLKAKLAKWKAYWEQESIDHRDARNQATARVQSMRRDCAVVVAKHHPDNGCGAACVFCAILAGIRALPLDTGTATDTGGEAELADPHVFCSHPPERNHACDVVERRQADAIKAAVVDEREACALIADRHEYGRTRGCLCNACKSGREIRARSGAVAPGAVGK